MSDFFQHGPITTLQRLLEPAVTAQAFRPARPVTLLLPCHDQELRALSLELAVRLPVEHGWGVEVGWLCEIYRHVQPDRVCQVDLAMRFDHKHQVLDLSQPERGLGRMAAHIALTMLTQLAREGMLLSPDALDRLSRAYQTSASDLVRRYGDVAAFNRLPFDASGEQKAVEMFRYNLDRSAAAFLKGARSAVLPAWDRMLKTGDSPPFTMLTWQLLHRFIPPIETFRGISGDKFCRSESLLLKFKVGGSDKKDSGTGNQVQG